MIDGSRGQAIGPGAAANTPITARKLAVLGARLHAGSIKYAAFDSGVSYGRMRHILRQFQPVRPFSRFDVMSWALVPLSWKVTRKLAKTSAARPVLHRRHRPLRWL